MNMWVYVQSLKQLDAPPDGIWSRPTHVLLESRDITRVAQYHVDFDSTFLRELARMH